MPTYMSRSIFLHTSLLFRWLEKWRVSFASEGKMQAEAGRQLGNDNLVGEAAPFSFMASGGVEINPAPFVYTPCLWDKIQIALERRVRMSCMCMYTMYLKTMLCRVGRLTWHDGVISDDKVWVEIGGDKGVGFFKMSFQLCNVPSPNSPHNTCFCSL